MSKKRHHYVPKAYLKFFCDNAVKLYVYRKDQPDKRLHQSPDNAAFERYYCSQPLADGQMDHDRLENFFSTYEDRWPALVHRIAKRQNVNDALRDLLDFIAIQRVRVPATRDAVETVLAESVMAVARSLDAAGKLPPKPPGREDILDHVRVSIDPHRSILAMESMLRGAELVLNRIGLDALRNTTDIPLLTSDNPVIWFDPSLPVADAPPYTIRADGPVALVFPISPQIVVWGDSSIRDRFINEGLLFGDLSAAVSPVLQAEVLPRKRGKALIFRYRFGKRTSKAKWKSA